MDLFMKAKNSFFGATQPTNPHSLENLKYLYGVLQRNPTVSDANRDILTETLRSISEILIWGDQNDSSVFDFVFEKGMLIYFLDYIRTKNGRYICVQILQTLSILFENIREETSLYYLLSNNHINNIISHRFDFSDEEITAYYISFLKTLSLKLNKSSINFFFNEREKKFPLYVEAIKFFDHPETMVRIAVRTLTLNVYKVPDPTMHRFILDCTATEYFSNLVWFIRNHVLDFDHSIRNNRDINNRGQVTSSSEEYLDHIHYLQDIFLLNVDSLNNVLKEQLMNRLLIPVYIFSLIKRDKFCRVKNPRIMLEQLTTFFLLAEIFLVIQYRPVVEELADLILSADIETVEAIQHRYGEQISYSLAPATLEVCLAINEPDEESDDTNELEVSLKVVDINDEDERRRYESEHSRMRSASSLSVHQKTTESQGKLTSLYVSNWTDDEKYRRSKDPRRLNDTQLTNRPYFEALIQALECNENDQVCFYALSILLTMTTNPCVDSVILESVCLTVKSSDKSFYNTLLVEKLCDIFQSATRSDSNIRLTTLSLAILLYKKLVYNEEKKVSYLSEEHFSRIEQVRKQATIDLRQYYSQQELLLDMFEDEYRQMQLNPIRLEYLLKDSCMLFLPTATPLSGVEFIKRLPSGNTERARRSIRVFFLIRSLVLELSATPETELPLIKPQELCKVNDKLDLTNCDLIACTVHMKERKDSRFLVFDRMQFILVESDKKRANWGIVKFCDLLQNVEVTSDKEDGCSLHIIIHKPVNNMYAKTNPPVLNAKFTFENLTRCGNAKDTLLEVRQKAREIKLSKIASILEIQTLPVHEPKLRSATTYTHHPFVGYSTSVLPNHPGRRTSFSGAKRQSVAQNIPTASRPLSASSTFVSSPTFSNIERIRSYSVFRIHSEDGSGSSTPTTDRGSFGSTTNSKLRRGSLQVDQGAKSLCGWQEQPFILDNANVRILSPNSERTHPPFFVGNDLLDEEVKSNDETDSSMQHVLDMPDDM